MDSSNSTVQTRANLILDYLHANLKKFCIHVKSMFYNTFRLSDLKSK